MGQYRQIILEAGGSLLLSKPPSRLSPQKQASPNRTALYLNLKEKSSVSLKNNLPV
jgi:hypothetical protein